MRISGIRSATERDRLRLHARFAWEDSDRAEQEIFFEIEGAPEPSQVDANIFLLVAYPIAAAHGESRIAIAEPTSPLLREHLSDVHAWWNKWGLASSGEPAIESPLAENVRPDDRPERSVALLSGGVDSLHMLRRNLSRFPRGSRHRITGALYFRGFQPEFSAEQRDASYEAAYDQNSRFASAVAAETGISLRQVDSNLRRLDPDRWLWIKQFHGPAHAAAAHAAIRGRAIVHMAATYDIANIAPWGSHPSIDPNLGTERISILHCGASFSRLDKVRELVSWPTAMANLWICTARIPGRLNCGECEKCMRTKLEIVAAGAEIPPIFANRSLDPELLHLVTDDYQVSCYRDVVGPLRARGLDEIASAVQWQIASSGPRLRLRRWKSASKQTLKRFVPLRSVSRS